MQFRNTSHTRTNFSIQPHGVKLIWNAAITRQAFDYKQKSSKPVTEEKI